MLIVVLTLVLSTLGKRNEYKGNHALGVGFVMMGVYGYLSGNITGKMGLKNRQKQNMRRAADWKPSKHLV